MSYLVLARKWRPTGFDDLAGQEPIVRILKNAITQNKIAHAYLFSGPRGVGKTSAARILSKAMNCREGPAPVPCGTCESCTAVTEGSSVDVIEIDGASNNSVDDIRDLRERVKYAPSGSKYKVYIIDEVHMLSASAFNALLKTLEEPPSHVIFVLATTALNKIPATILSRCQHMPFRRISGNEIKKRLKEISGAEGIKISSQALSLVARAADGSMRDSLTILDQLSSFTTEITDEDIKNLLGIADTGMLLKISHAIVSGNRTEILGTIKLLSEQGADMKSFTKELVQFFRDLLVTSVTGNAEDVFESGSEEISGVMDILSASSEDQLLLMLSEIVRAESDVRNSSQPRMALEMSLMKASFLSAMKPVKTIIENLNLVEKQYRPGQGGGKEREDTSDMSEKSGAKNDSGAENMEKAVIPERQPEGEKEISGQVQTPAQAGPESAGDIEQVWHRVLEKIEAPLASKISQAEIELNGKELIITLNGGHSVFEDALRKDLRTIEKMLSEESGTEFAIRIATKNKKPTRKRDLKEKIMNEPVIKEALELFEGRIVDVTPVEKPDNTNNGGYHV